MSSRPLMRIPYTSPLPAPRIIPATASTVPGAISALTNFLTPHSSSSTTSRTVLLTGAGLSTPSGLADYRGPGGTYTLHRSYRPIYYHEFLTSHESRKRYWARSFLGWRGLDRSKPNASHFAIRDLAKLGVVSGVVTQNVDSFHSIAHGGTLKTVELHGFLRALVCLSCKRLMSREEFQGDLARLNPRWDGFLAELLASGALETEDPVERRKKGYRTNPDGDADVPGAPYSTFRYPACPKCLVRPPVLEGGVKGRVVVDGDGAWNQASTAGVLKPNVIMFGESILEEVKREAELIVEEAERMLVVGSSLATYSAWRLVKMAIDRGMGVGVLNVGGVRKEEVFFPETLRDMDSGKGLERVRVSLPAEEVLPGVVKMLGESK